MAQDLAIWMLGGFGVSVGGRAVPASAWRRNRARALVKLLALASGHRLHREQVIDVLWPTLGPDAGGNNLRKAIHFARQAVGAEHVRSHGDAVALEAPSLLVDVEAFESALSAGRRAEALEIYRGDLLPDDRFEPWTEDPRERLRARFHRLLLTESAALEGRGDLAASTDVLERLIASDPLHEEAHLALVRVLAASGARHLAVARYRQFAERLRAELDIEPEERLRFLVEVVGSGRFPETGGVAELGSARAGDRGSITEDEVRLVTVLAVALEPASRDPASARVEHDRWASRAMAIVRAWGGVGELTPTGDMLAIFGAPTAHEDDLHRALRASLEIAEQTSCQVGVASGEALVHPGSGPLTGRMSSPAIREARAMRDVAGRGGVVVNERVRSAAPPAARFAGPHRRSPEQARSSSQLVGYGSGESLRSRPESPLIGREPELAVVIGLFEEAVANGRPRLVELSGPAGVGKSRLAAELINRITARYPRARILRGRCLPGGRGPAFDALGEILRDACGITITDSAEEARARLRRGLASLLEGVDPLDLEPTTMALAATAGMDLPGSSLGGLSPAEVNDRVTTAWSVCATACASSGPAVILIEDLHWAQQELLDLVERMVGRADGPLLVIVTTRPELRERGVAFGTVDASTISIRPLADAHSLQLLRLLTREAELDERLQQDVLARAEGNPLYLEQLTHHVRSGGAGVLPDTLHSLLTARLDSLPAAERRVLQEASVVGRVFWEAPIAAALEGERVHARLASLERKGFVIRRTTSRLKEQAEYSIRHALIHDVAYESLSRERRARAHAAAGAWLEAVTGDRVDEVIDLLAHHYWAALSANAPRLVPDDGVSRATIRAKAFESALRAGDLARRRFVTDRAIELHQRALNLAATVPERVAALEALGRDQEEAFHGDDAAQQYGEALALARASARLAGDRARLCRRLAWMMAWNPGSFRASPSATQAEALVDEGMAHAVDPGERAWLLLVRGACARLYRGSEPLGQGSDVDPQPIATRLAAAEQAMAEGREQRRHEVVIAAEHVLGMLYGLAGKYEPMLELARRQVAELQPEDSRIDQSDAIRKLAIHLINVRADFEQGLELGWRCHDLVVASHAGGPHQVMHTLWPILASLYFLGRLEEVRAPLAEHVAAFRAEPAMECQFVRDGPAIGAAALYLLGRLDESAELAGLLGDPLADREGASAWQARLAIVEGDPATARMISADKAIEGRIYGPQHAAVLLDTLAALGDWAAAEAFLPHARRAVPGNALIEPTADRVAGQIGAATGDPATAIRLLRRSVRGFRRLKVPLEEARSLDALANTLPAAAANTPWAAARAIYDRLGIRPLARASRPDPRRLAGAARGNTAH